MTPQPPQVATGNNVSCDQSDGDRAEVVAAAPVISEPSVPFAQADPVAKFDFAAHLHRQREWSTKTFGPGTRQKGVCDHIRKELLEIEQSPLDHSEWADVVILALDGFWRCGASPQNIITAIVAKQTKNEGRTWPDWRTMPEGSAIEHDRTKDRAPTSPARAVDDSMRNALRKLRAYVGVCDGDKELTERIIPDLEAALAPSTVRAEQE